MSQLFFNAIRLIRGTTTLLPACLYSCPLETSLGNLKSLGYPCTLNVSFGVNFPNTVIMG